MPIKVFGNSNSNNKGNKIDTSLFVQKPYLRSIFIAANIEEDIDLKIQFIFMNLPCPQENSDAVCKPYVGSVLNDLSIIKNTSL